MSPQLKKWLKFERIVPLGTVATALAAGIADVLDLIELTVAEDVIITILGLLAADALVERTSILERIHEAVLSIPKREMLRGRDQIVRIQDMAAGAREIAAAGISLISLVNPNITFYRRKLDAGCNMRFLLLDPTSQALETWDAMLPAPTTAQDINSVLANLSTLLKHEAPGRCEVRLSRVYLPFSLVMVDPGLDTGRMTVEMHVYKMGTDERLHFILDQVGDRKWFDFFRGQFEDIWEDSRPWDGTYPLTPQG